MFLNCVLHSGLQSTDSDEAEYLAMNGRTIDIEHSPVIPKTGILTSVVKIRRMGTENDSVSVMFCANSDVVVNDQGQCECGAKFNDFQWKFAFGSIFRSHPLHRGGTIVQENLTM